MFKLETVTIDRPTLVYTLDESRYHWAILTPYGEPQIYCANGYATFHGWRGPWSDPNATQVHGWASSPENSSDARAYFRRELRAALDEDERRGPQSVRKVRDLEALRAIVKPLVDELAEAGYLLPSSLRGLETAA